MLTNPEIYGSDFYDFMNRSQRAYWLLADAIHKAVRGLVGDPYVLDVGCGSGLVCQRLRQLGWATLGIDGPWAKLYAERNGLEFKSHDFTTDDALHVDPSPLVICTETAEHLPDARSDTLISFVAHHATEAIVFSAARPGQDADDPGHINLQPLEYWLDKFERNRWSVDQPATSALQLRMHITHAQHFTVKENFVVLRRQ